jgi:hypothetical protein
MAGSVRFVRRLLLCVIVVSALAACGDNGFSSPGAAPDSAETSAAAVPATGAVATSLLLSAPRVGGGTVNLADYAGKPVVLWFWAPT